MDNITRDNIEVFLRMPLAELICYADGVRRRYAGCSFEACSIINAKSGLCSEDCKFCAQSGRHKADAEVYPLLDAGKMIEAAGKARESGAQRFGIVTSGNRLNEPEIRIIAKAVSDIRKTIGISVCGSLGALNETQLKLLKDAGLSRYHHNIETSPSYYSKIVTTHNFSERKDTINAAKRAGLEVCSGGIIGMGESWQDRIEMAFLLKELDVDSVPLNILTPIKGTPFESMEPLSCDDAVRTIALFRIILRDKTIRLAAGRETALADFQALAFLAGANAMLIGGYLTTRGREIIKDQKLVSEIQRIWQI